MTRLKILISGGGIAGNALAFWLSLQGHNVTVIERFSSLRTTGLQIDLRGHGIEVLKRMGLEQKFRSKSAPEQGWQIVDSSGRRRAYFPANKSGTGLQSFTTDFEIMRGDLVQMLYDENKERVRYLFGTSIVTFTQGDSCVEVQLSNGSTDTFDLLVGADGQWSRTRRMMVGPDKPDGLQLINNMYIGYFTMHQPIQDGEDYIATTYMSPGRRGIMTRRHSPDSIQVYLGCTTDSQHLKNARRGDTKAEKEAMTEIFNGAGWQTAQILDSLKDADDFYCERMGVVQLDTWSQGRVVLVGDAAYCPTANTGMGVTSGIVGAYVLAGEISEHCTSTATNNSTTNINESLASALQSYESKFRPFMTQVQKGVLEDKGFFPSSSFGIAMFYCVTGLASFLKIDLAQWFLKEKVRDWMLPDYDGMVGMVGREGL